MATTTNNNFSQLADIISKEIRLIDINTAIDVIEEMEFTKDEIQIIIELENAGIE